MSTPPIISSDGSMISVHRGAGVTIPFTRGTDDISGEAWTFFAKGCFSISLQPDPSNPNGLRLNLGELDIVKLPDSGVEFFIKNGSAVPSEIVLEGRIVPRGFTGM